eukprot:3815958-Pleurochrysis_carterae.AAC.1
MHANLRLDLDAWSCTFAFITCLTASTSGKISTFACLGFIAGPVIGAATAQASADAQTRKLTSAHGDRAASRGRLKH